MLAVACALTSRAVAAPPESIALLPDAVAAAQALLAALDEPARATVQLALDAPDRRTWRRDPSPRPGLARGDMSDTQRRLLDRLLDTVLSDQGRSTVHAVMQEQDVLAQGEGGLGSGLYWLAIYGTPGEGAWAWRYGGHHVSLHAAYRGAELVSATPVMLGGEQETDDAAAWTGYRSLRPRVSLARDVVGALDAGTWETAQTGDRATGILVLSEPQAAALGVPDSGVELVRLGEAARRHVASLVHEYAAVFEPAIAQDVLRRFEDAAAEARFAWAGSREVGAAHYYRVQAPGFLVEYSNSGSHAHTLMRTARDWGDVHRAR
jgi:hypothetical protein